MKIKNLIVTVVFSLFIAAFFFLCILHEPLAASESERRPLAQMPEITFDGVISGETISDLEDYTVDQFPMRDSFRKLYTWYRFNIMQLKDTNDLAIEDGYIAKVETGLNTHSVEHAIGKFQYIYETYLKDNGGKTYFAVVPDKNYFFSKEYGYISMDYARMLEILRAGLPEAEFIELFDVLELSDYYKTDTHWSQDKIGAVADRIAEKLGCADRLSGTYTVNKLHPFYGVYYGQAALDLPADTIYYLTNDTLDACTVYDYETGTTSGIYDLAKFDSKEPYDIFLSGTKALLRIDNPNATTDKELVVFRDSFGSSLMPLLAEGYSSIYIVDIRYVMSSMVGNFIDFTGKDTLFLYSTLVLNDSLSLK